MSKERYEIAGHEAEALLHQIRTEHFGHLHSANIQLLLDTKKRVAKGVVVLARIVKPTDLLLHFSQYADGITVDYIITVDKKAWLMADKPDRARILRHELRHAFYDIENEDDPYKILGHELEDFYEEVRLNQDDPRWAERMVELTGAAYEQEAEMKRDKAKPRRV